LREVRASLAAAAPAPVESLEAEVAASEPAPAPADPSLRRKPWRPAWRRCWRTGCGDAAPRTCGRSAEAQPAAARRKVGVVALGDGGGDRLRPRGRGYFFQGPITERLPQAPVDLRTARPRQEDAAEQLQIGKF